STTGQPDFPTVAPLQACAAASCPRGACNSGTVSQLSGDGSSLLFSTCIGTAGHDVIVNGIAGYGKGLKLAAKDFTPGSVTSANRSSARDLRAAGSPSEQGSWYGLLEKTDLACKFLWSPT